MNKLALEIAPGTTFRLGIGNGYMDDDGTKHFYGPDHIASMTLKFRSGPYGIIHQENGVWDEEAHVYRFVVSATDTEQFSTSRNTYYVVDVTYNSGDVKRLREGIVRVRPLGGAEYK